MMVSLNQPYSPLLFAFEGEKDAAMMTAKNEEYGPSSCMVS